MDNMGLFFLPTGGALSVVVTGDGAHLCTYRGWFCIPGLPSTYFFNEQEVSSKCSGNPKQDFHGGDIGLNVVCSRQCLFQGKWNCRSWRSGFSQFHSLCTSRWLYNVIYVTMLHIMYNYAYILFTLSLGRVETHMQLFLQKKVALLKPTNIYPDLLDM